MKHILSPIDSNVPDIPSEQQRLLGELCLVWASIIFSWAGITIATPMILKDIVGTSMAAEYQGICTSISATSGMVFCVLLGHLSDNFGRLRILIPWMFCFTTSVSLVVYADAYQNVVPIFISRIAALSIPSSLVYALSSDFLSGQNVLKGHSYLGGTFGIAMLLGSGMCGYIARVYTRYIALIICVMVSLIAPIFSMTFMKNESLFTRNKSKYNSQSDSSGNQVSSSNSSAPKKSILDAINHIFRRDPLLRTLIISFSILRVANISTMLMFTLYVNYRFKWDLLDCAILLGVIGALGVVWQVVGARYIVERHQNVVPFLIGSMACLPIACVGKGLSRDPVSMWIFCILGSLIGLSSTIFTSKISMLGAEDGLAGLSLGVVGTIQNFMEMFMAIFFGKFLSWAITTYPPDSIGVGIPFFVNGITYTLALALVCYGHYFHGQYRQTWITHGDNIS
eukprot:Tbor_TRINITY_DN3546_c0_g1::TRINITY_DN3546_c0_g1_i1::g.2927::m.2927/K08151/tetA; MFS transporter, DHA1 family, tetracycline resistance protein